MVLPFTTRQFLDVFAQYNTAIWPLQLVLTAAALLTLTLAWRGGSGRVIGFSLAAQWAWTGVVYHFVFFRRINPAAVVFAGLWLAGAAAFAWNAAGRARLRFPAHQAGRLAVGGLLGVYGLAVYPILGALSGHAYPHGPTYGAPCPVAIVSIATLWLAAPSVPRYLLAAPVLWAAVGSSAAFTLGIREDLGLLAAGLSGLVLLVERRRPAATSERVAAGR